MTAASTDGAIWVIPKQTEELESGEQDTNHISLNLTFCELRDGSLPRLVKQAGDRCLPSAGAASPAHSRPACRSEYHLVPSGKLEAAAEAQDLLMKLTSAKHGKLVAITADEASNTRRQQMMPSALHC